MDLTTNCEALLGALRHRMIAKFCEMDWDWGMESGARLLCLHLVISVISYNLPW